MRACASDLGDTSHITCMIVGQLNYLYDSRPVKFVRHIITVQNTVCTLHAETYVLLHFYETHIDIGIMLPVHWTSELYE